LNAIGLLFEKTADSKPGALGHAEVDAIVAAAC